MIVYFIMIIGFSYFYSTIQFNPVEIANNLKKQGGFIPGDEHQFRRMGGQRSGKRFPEAG